MAILYDGASYNYRISTADVEGGNPIMTIAAWAKTSDAAPNQTIYRQYSTVNNTRTDLQFLGGTPGDTVRIYCKSFNITWGARDIVGYTINTAHSVIGQNLNSSDRAIYLDGSGPGVKVSSAPAQTEMNAVLIGYLVGTVMAIAVWAAYLSADEIISLSKGRDPRTVNVPSLVAYYRMHGNYLSSNLLLESVSGKHLNLANGTPAKSEAEPVIRNYFMAGSC